MFEKFGEFDSAEELNTMAATAMEQGETAKVLELAKENGINELDAQDYIDGMSAELCTPLMAAIGKLELEKAELKLPAMMEGMVMMVQGMFETEPELVVAVRKKGKKLAEVLGKILKACSENRKPVPGEVAKAAGFKETIYTGDIDIAEFKKQVKKYYIK